MADHRPAERVGREEVADLLDRRDDPIIALFVERREIVAAGDRQQGLELIPARIASRVDRHDHDEHLVRFKAPDARRELAVGAWGVGPTQVHAELAVLDRGQEDLHRQAGLLLLDQGGRPSKRDSPALAFQADFATVEPAVVVGLVGPQFDEERPPVVRLEVGDDVVGGDPRPHDLQRVAQLEPFLALLEHLVQFVRIRRVALGRLRRGLGAIALVDGRLTVRGRILNRRVRPIERRDRGSGRRDLLYGLAEHRGVAPPERDPHARN